MAMRDRRARASLGRISSDRIPSIDNLAQQVGMIFGTTEAHARRWLSQCNELVNALSTVRDKANSLLAELGKGVPSPFGKRKKARSATATVGPLTDTPRKRRVRRQISDDTRAKMRAAAQRRWAENKKAGGGSKRGSLTPNGTVPRMAAK